MAGNAVCLSHSKPVSNQKEMCACSGALLSSKPLVGPEKHSETPLAVIPDTRLASGCATRGIKKLCYSRLLAPGTLELQKILALIEGLGVRVILNKEPHTARFLACAKHVPPWSVGIEGALASELELGRLCRFLAWKRNRLHKSYLCVLCAFLSARVLWLVGTELF